MPLNQFLKRSLQLSLPLRQASCMVQSTPAVLPTRTWNHGGQRGRLPSPNFLLLSEKCESRRGKIPHQEEIPLLALHDHFRFHLLLALLPHLSQLPT